MSKRGEGLYVTRLQLTFVTVIAFLSAVIGYSLAAVPPDTLYMSPAGVSVFVADYVNATVAITAANMNGGSIIASNGTWIAHGLAQNPGTTGSITLALRGPSSYNATRILRVPTVLQSNSTHFQIEFLAWETIGWTLVPVTPSWAQMVWWDAKYIP